jgi:hypothetical protein
MMSNAQLHRGKGHLDAVVGGSAEHAGRCARVVVLVHQVVHVVVILGRTVFRRLLDGWPGGRYEIRPRALLAAAPIRLVGESQFGVGGAVHHRGQKGRCTTGKPITSAEPTGRGDDPRRVGV